VVQSANQKWPSCQREIVLARWGLVSLKDGPANDKPNGGTTNFRHPWFED
jgi:hypothetical protein